MAPTKRRPQPCGDCGASEKVSASGFDFFQFRPPTRREDARQIVENVTGFFSVLADWAREERPEPANDTGKPGGADNGGEVRYDR